MIETQVSVCPCSKVGDPPRGCWLACDFCPNAEKGKAPEEWLFIWQEHDDTFSFSLSNAPRETPLPQLALWRAQRYFAERIFQDAKSEAGRDELVARKYRAWMHHIALDALALWFVAETRLDWAQAYPRDPELIG